MSKARRGLGESILRSRVQVGSFRPGRDPRGFPRPGSTTSMVSRGDVWLVDLGPPRGHEQSGMRPSLVVSVDAVHDGPSDLLVVVPLTTRDRRLSLHVRIDPPEGGVRARSFAKPEDVRSISGERLKRRWGTVSTTTLAAVESRLRKLLGL